MIIEIKVLPRRMWNWRRWEWDGVDPFNKRRWAVFTPCVCVWLNDPSIPDIDEVSSLAESILHGRKK